MNKKIVTYKSKRLFHAMCYNADDETLNRIMKEDRKWDGDLNKKLSKHTKNNLLT